MTPVKAFKSVKLGAWAEHAYSVMAEAARVYVDLTGDYNPVHVDADYARGTRFGTRAARGLLRCRLVQRSLTELVAPGGVSLSYEFRLKPPVFIEGSVTASAMVDEKVPEGKEGLCSVAYVNERQKTAVASWAMIKMLEKGARD